MCLAVPSKLISIDGLNATVDVYGARKEISLILMPEQVEVGEYVLVHAGFAIQKIDEQAAIETLALFDEIAEKMDEDSSS
ncbi:MAG: HypC/HybG/HupF family hydrogenase formation chaperone [Dissulfurispiraceae bacterium]|jgi:hydrogenase expression/formation protein HypC|nr:HypC/HybG/HupF family hydrogenase formation chaperone [Dissulfurispiraceae bacterium]